jgi:hypothetical protein
MRRQALTGSSMRTGKSRQTSRWQQQAHRQQHDTSRQDAQQEWDGGVVVTVYREHRQHPGPAGSLKWDPPGSLPFSARRRTSRINASLGSTSPLAASLARPDDGLHGSLLRSASNRLSSSVDFKARYHTRLDDGIQISAPSPAARLVDGLQASSESRLLWLRANSLFGLGNFAL